jgi:hypothetical protein
MGKSFNGCNWVALLRISVMSWSRLENGRRGIGAEFLEYRVNLIRFLNRGSHVQFVSGAPIFQ